MDFNPVRASSGSSVRHLVILITAALAVAALLAGLSVAYAASASGYWPGYDDMMASLPSPAAWLRWVVGDISEVAFYKHEFASLGLLLGGRSATGPVAMPKAGKASASPTARGCGLGW